MNLRFGVQRLARFWSLIGIGLLFGGLVGIALSVLMGQKKLQIEPAKLPPPANLLAANLAVVGPLQAILGAVLVVASVGLLRRSCYGWIAFQITMVAVMGWFLFLGGYTLWNSLDGLRSGSATPLLFPALIGGGFVSATCGFSMWLLNRPPIKSEFQCTP